jgi:hypothetical protein
VISVLALEVGFAGGRRDYERGLVRFGSRDHDPQAGCWLDKEPLRENAC